MIYFKHGLNKNMKNIYIHRSIIILSSSFFGMFGIIFLYKILDNSILNLALWSGISSIGYIALILFLKKIIEKIGSFKNMIITGTIMSSLLLSSYFITSYLKLELGWILILIMLILSKTLYWVPMHTQLIESTDTSNRSSMFATMRIITNIIGILSPILTGFLIAKYGFYSPFLIGFLISLLAIFPIFKLKEKKHKKEVVWSSKKIIHEFFAKKNKKFILALYARGVEVSVGLIVWPIFIYKLFNGDFFKIGALSTMITIFVIILNIIQGKLGNKKGIRKKMMKYGTWMYSFGWFLKIFVSTATLVFIVDSYQRMSRGFSFVSFDSFVYDYISDQGNLADEYTILREISLHFGKISGFILITIGSFFMPLNYLFIIAILATIALNILPTQKDAHGEKINS